jgi:ssDNA-binding replication factor A large subunit
MALIQLNVNEYQHQELQELVKEKKEQLEALLAHYENSLEALQSAGDNAAMQRLNFQAAINENKSRLQLFKVLHNQIKKA